MSKANCSRRTFFYLFFFLWEWTIQSCWFIKKIKLNTGNGPDPRSISELIRNRSCFRGDIIKIHIENSVALQFERKKQGQKKKEWIKEREWKQNFTLLCKCAASAVTDSSVGTWEQSRKPLMPKKQAKIHTGSETHLILVLKSFAKGFIVSLAKLSDICLKIVWLQS